MRFHKESGSATILAFGLTIMIMSLAIGFLSTSLVGKKASSNHMEVVVARMSAQNALSRAIAAVRCAQDHTLSYNELFSMSEKSMSDTEKNDLKALLPTTYNKIVYISNDTVANMVESSETDSDLSWIYQSSNIGTSDKNISRMAYAIIGQPDYYPQDPPDTPKYPDAFYYNPDSDTPKITDYRKYLYQRFNLARDDWGSLTVDNFLENNIEWSIDAPVSNTIKYLREFDDGPGTFTDVDPRRKQIIANLIDYCDENDSSTTDDENAPTYTGNDKTPYINEVRIIFEGIIHSFELFGNPVSFYIFRIRNIDIELVNMYQTGSIVINAEATYQYEYTIGSSAETPDPVTENISITAADEGYFTGVHYYNTYPGDFHIVGPIYEASQGITGVRIKELKVKLTNGAKTEFYDFSNVDLDPGSLSGDLIAVDGTGFSLLYFDYEVNDPRQNLWEGDWTNTVRFNVENGTIGAKNSVCALPIPVSATNRDTEIESDPWDISTASIRNTPMGDIYELGYIHRGAAWQTINLKSFNTGTDYAYGKGDAKILDQVKIGSANERIIITNLNTRDRERLEELFTLEPLTSPDTLRELSNNMLENLPRELRLSRAAILENTDADTDIADYLTSKMYNGQEDGDIGMELFTGALNYAEALPYEKFYVIAVGQAIKEIDGHKDAIPKEYDKTDQILSTQKMIAEVIKDPGDDNNPYKIIRIRYLEE